jgi:hypothetical protein
MTCDKSCGEFVGMFKVKLCIMQVLAQSLNNHNLVASLLVTLIVIHEFSWLQKYRSKVVHPTYRQLKSFVKEHSMVRKGFFFGILGFDFHWKGCHNDSFDFLLLILKVCNVF